MKIFLVQRSNLVFIFLLQKYQKFLESELANNQEKEKKVGVAERQAAKLRLEYQDSEQIRIQFQDEVNQNSTEDTISANRLYPLQLNSLGMSWRGEG